MDSKGYTPLFYAAKANGMEASYYLLDLGKADPNHQCQNGKTPLFKVSTYEDAKLLLRFGADQNIKTYPKAGAEGKTALQYLVENCYADSPLAILDNDISKLGDDILKVDLKLPSQVNEKLGLHKLFLDYVR